jgi:small subunit ribosomal protein S1
MMSEFDNPAGPPDDAASPKNDSKPGGDIPEAGGGLPEDVAREVDAAMAAMSSDDLAELTGLDQPQEVGDAAPGSRCKGKIAGIYEEDIFIDLGGKTQAIVPRSHFGKEEVLEVGREVEVLVERFDRDSGCLVVSRDGAVREARWESMAVGDIVEGRITGMNKGGLEVNLSGIRGFMPASQVDIAHVKDISVFLGQKWPCEIIELNRRDRNVLLSHKRVLERELAERKETLLGELSEGQIRKGVVGNLTAFGAFVDLGGVDGLIHISDLSYKQVNRVADVVQPGQEVEVKVLGVDKKRNRIKLGLKQVMPDPWAGVEDKYPLGSQVTVRVLRLEKFGAFVELEEGIEGLIPLSEMSWTRIGKAADVLEVSQMVKAVVIRVDAKERRIALSLKQVEADPWAGVFESFPKNSTQMGKVTKCEKFGAFVELAPGVEGLVHISELSDQRVRNCEEVVQPGQEVEVRVLDVDTEARRISLSIKATKEAAPGEGTPDKATGAPKKKKRKKPLRGGLTSHFDW